MRLGPLMFLVGAAVFVRRTVSGETVYMDVDQPDPVRFSSAVQRFAEAIAYAEGYGKPGAVPTRLNNPGDLKLSSVPSIGKDASGHLHFATVADGWLALHRQLQLIIDGKSRVYTLDMTILQMGQRYAPPAPETWAANVATSLRVSVGARLRDVLL